MSADLHIHSTFSDGSMGARQICRAAKGAGLSAIALTDHDTEKSALFCEENTFPGLRLIPGVEVSAFDPDRGRRVHLLYYYPHYKEEHLSYFKRMTEQRTEAARKIEEKLTVLYPAYDPAFTRTFLEKGCAPFKAHILRQLGHLGYTDGYYNEFYHRLFGKGGPCVAPVEYLDVWSALALFKSCGGAVVLAHPSVYHSMELARELAAKGLLDGVEIAHPRNTPEDKEELWKLVQKYDLLVTGGTDFHGQHAKTPRPIGTCVVSDEVCDVLREISQKRNNSNCEK